MNNFTLLVTKKISSSLVLQAGLKGINVLEKEFIRVVPIVNDHLNKKINKLVSGNNTVVFTSKNAVAAVAANNRFDDPNWKIYCIEGATKKEVRKYFDETLVAGAAKNASALAEVIAEKNDGNKVIFFCGNKRREDLPLLLKQRGLEVEEIIVYNTELIPQKIVDDYEAVAFFSPSAVESFFTDNTLKKNIICFSVGRTTTETLKKYTRNEVITSDKPSEESVIDLATRYSKH
jgi:uroporphyrinogen-III synthase